MLEQRGHVVTYGNKTLPRGSKDSLVCIAALNDGAVLVACDHDMKRIAKEHGANKGEFKKLSLVKLTCRKPEAAAKIANALSLIEHEWEFTADNKGRRICIEIQTRVIRTERE